MKTGVMGILVLLATGAARAEDGTADESACLKGDAAACTRAIATAKKERPDVAPSERLQQLQVRACELGDGRSCRERAEFAPTMIEVAALRLKACEAKRPDLVGCELYGKQLRQGLGVTQDVNKGTQLIERACAGNAFSACIRLMAIAPKNPRYIVQIKRGCDLKDPTCCAMTGDLYTKGFGLAADPVKAKAAYAVACKGGVSSACGK